MSSILVVNGGSATIKLALFDLESLEQQETVTLESLEHFDSNPDDLLEQLSLRPHEAAHLPIRQRVTQWLTSFFHAKPSYSIEAVGHRFVHGGDHLTESAVITEPILGLLHSLVPLAPLHTPHALSYVHYFSDLFPDSVHYACFDTAFHKTVPEHRRLFPIPLSYAGQGVKKYGFHGLAYQSVLEQLYLIDETAPQKRIVMLHLGSGCSSCGVLHSVSHITSMGFSTLDGIMMGSRPGCLDPGVILHLLKSLNINELEEFLYQKCGLLGVSDLSQDMKELENSSSVSSQLALRLFFNSVEREMFSIIGALQGIDILVFSGGIGENSWKTREEILTSLKWLGLEFYETANKEGALSLHTNTSKIKAYIIKSDEAKEIARSYKRLRTHEGTNHE